MTPSLFPPLHSWRRSGLLLLALGFAPLSPAAAAESAVDGGRKLFQNLCATCHGFEGSGASAPGLNRPKLEYAPDEPALRRVIVDGIAGRGMPRVRRWTDNELGQLVAYVQSLGHLPAASLTGNPQRGAEVYARLGCATCHIVNGQGGTLGPELTAIGKMRGVAYLREAVVNPGATLPRGTLPVPARGYSEFLPVLAVTSDGKEIRGVRINEDSLSIQVRDEQSQLHSLRKSELSRLEKLTGASLMPNVSAQLAATELDDLIAYLASLQGTP